MKPLTTTKALAAWAKLQPLSEEDAKRLCTHFAVDFNYNTNHMMGNGMTYGQTRYLLMHNRVIGSPTVRDVHDMRASDAALMQMKEQAALKEVPMTVHFILTLHKTMMGGGYTEVWKESDNAPVSFQIHSGQYKTDSNYLAARFGEVTKYASPEETPELMDQLVEWYNKEERETELTPIELAAIFHYRFVRIHPFDVGNGRMARLLVNFILARHDYPMIIFHSNKKTEYIEALYRADAEYDAAKKEGLPLTAKSIYSFCKYMNDLVVMEMNNVLLFLTEKSKRVWWYNGERLSDRPSNYTKLLIAMLQNDKLTLEDMREVTKLNKRSVQKLLEELLRRHYVEPGDEPDSWRVFVSLFYE